MTAQVAADLRAAAEVLRRDGWTQGVYHAKDGSHCIDGALICATPRSPRRYTEASNALLEHLRQSSIGWNDRPGRTADEVIAELEAAADAAEARS